MTDPFEQFESLLDEGDPFDEFEDFLDLYKRTREEVILDQQENAYQHAPMSNGVSLEWWRSAVGSFDKDVEYYTPDDWKITTEGKVITPEEEKAISPLDKIFWQVYQNGQNPNEWEELWTSLPYEQKRAVTRALRDTGTLGYMMLEGDDSPAFNTTDQPVERRPAVPHGSVLAQMKDIADTLPKALVPKMREDFLRGEKEAPYKWLSMGKRGFFESLGDIRYEEKIPLAGKVLEAGRLMELTEGLEWLKDFDELLKTKQALSDRGFQKVMRPPETDFQTQFKLQGMIQDYIEEIEYLDARGTDIFGQIGEGGIDALTFMAEFVITRGFAQAARHGVQEASTKMLVKYGDKALVAALIKKGGLAAELLAGAAARLPLMAGHVEAEAVRRMMPKELGGPGQGFVEAMVKGVGTTMIELVSEEMGPELSKAAGRLMGRIPVVKKLGSSEFLRKVWKGLKLPDSRFNRVMSKAGFHGVLEEMGEERVGDFFRAVTGVEDFGLTEEENNIFNRLIMQMPKKDQLLVEAGIFIIPGGMRRGASLVGRYARNRMTAKEAAQEIAEKDPEFALNLIRADQKDRTSRGFFEKQGVTRQTIKDQREELLKELEKAIVERTRREAEERAKEEPKVTPEVGEAEKDVGRPGETEAEKKAEPQIVAEHHLHKLVKASLDTKTGISEAQLHEIMEVAYGGTMAEGAYNVSQAHDALETAVNAHVKEATGGIYNPAVGVKEAKETIHRLNKLLKLLPKQKGRAGEKETYQQFSTPPHYSYSVAWLANMTGDDVVLEPSAGTGSLAAFADNATASVIVNELSEERVELLKELGFWKVLNEDAEQIHNILPGKVELRPTRVIMNPPFSRAAKRMGEKKVIGTDLKHIDASLKALQDGGRLVAIVGAPMKEGTETQTFRRWLREAKKKYNVRAIVSLPRNIYRKYGTEFPTRVLVIDKTGPWKGKLVQAQASSLLEMVSTLEGVRNDLAKIEPERVKPAVQRPAAEKRPERKPKPPVQRPTPHRGPGVVREPAPKRPGERPERPVGEGLRAPRRKPEGEPKAAPKQPRPAPPSRKPAGEKKPREEPGPRGRGEPAGRKPVVQPERRKPAPKPRRRITENLSEEKQERLEELKKRIKKNFTERATAGLDAETMLLLAEAGKLYVEAGVRSFADWARTLVDELGEKVKPHLKSIYAAVALAPDNEFAQEMTPISDVVQISNKQLDELLKKKVAEVPLLTREEVEEADVFIPYQPQLKYSDKAHKHPASLVESVALSATKHSLETGAEDVPELLIPKKLIEEGRLSNEQLEAIVLGVKAHEDILPANEGEPPLRKGFMVGDGPGVGKGRIISGMLIHYREKAKKEGKKFKAIWFSEKKDLYKSAQRDWEQTGQELDELFLHHDTLSQAELPDREGILFSTYSMFTAAPKEEGATTRRNQIENWIAGEEDVVIIFDEAHNMKNALSEEGGKKVAKRAVAGVELQRFVPNAKVLYVSATAATEVSNLAYADRLGLWGRGTAFPDKRRFVDSIQSGGVASMELVSRDMKAMGLYIARSISYNDGTPEGTVTTKKLQHNLSKNQVVIYDKLCEAWQIVLANISAALGETGAANDKTAKRYAMSRFYFTMQRFFNQTIQSIQMPTIIKSIEADLKAGLSPVIQVVSTGEAPTDRMLSRFGPEDDLDDFDLTPKQELMDMVERGFPVYQYEEQTDEDGNTQWVRAEDSEGNPIVNREAVERRDALLEELGSIKALNYPLDMLVDHFGPKVVAEATGRKQRVEWVIDEHGERHRKIVPRGDAAINTDLNDFFEDKKQMLIFSVGKAGTGATYSASLDYKNQRKRTHYVVEAGWIADRCMQGLGRTHRTNQKQTPEYLLCECPQLPGQKRFITSIARRLAQLGALTMGERKAAGGGLYTAADNLESKQAQAALQEFFRELHKGAFPFTIEEFQTQTGLKLVNEKTGGLFDKLPAMKDFLNRILALKIDTQRTVFTSYHNMLQDKIDAAMADGSLDVGVEVYKADKIQKLEEKHVHRHESGAETKYVKLGVSRSSRIIPWDDLQRGVGRGNREIEFYARSITSGRVYAAVKATTRTDTSTGEIVDRYRIIHQTDHRGYIDQYKIDNDLSNRYWEKIPEDEAREEWDTAVAEAPEFKESEEHIITGAVLPIWDRLDGNPKVYRMFTDEGEHILGRVIPSTQLRATLRRLQVETDAPKVDTAVLVKQLERGEVEVVLANNWKLRKMRVKGETRIELHGPSFQYNKELESDGVFREKVNYDTRYFIPVGKKAAKVLESITRDRPVVDIIYTKTREAGASFAGQLIPDYNSLKQPASFTVEEPESRKGRRLLRKLKRDSESGENKVGNRSIIEFVNNLLHLKMFVTKTQTRRGKPGVYRAPEHVVFSRSGIWQLDFHEAGHALSFYTQDQMTDWWKGMENDLIALTYMDGSNASANTGEEGMAELIRRYITEHGTIPRKLREGFEELLKEIDPNILAGIRDAHRAYTFQRGRPPVEQTQTYTNDKGPKPTARQAANVFWHNFLFDTLGGTTVINYIKRKMYTGIAGKTSIMSMLRKLYREKQAAARSFVEGLTDSPSDFEGAYQATKHVKQYVARALVGTGKEQGIRIPAVWRKTGRKPKGRAPLNAKEVELLREAGFYLPEDIRKTKQGWPMDLYGESVYSIMDKIAPEFHQEFEFFVWYTVALERYEREGHEYPGYRDGLTPEIVKAELERLEDEHEDFPVRTAEIKEYMDQLLLLAVFSQEKSVKEAITIKTKWEHYAPLLREVEDRPTRKEGVGRLAPDSGIRAAFGSALPFKHLLESVEIRTRQAYDAYLENWRRIAFRNATKLFDKTDAPFEVRKSLTQILIPLKLDPKMVAKLSPKELAKPIADYLDKQKAKQLDMTVAELRASGQGANEKDIEIDTPSHPVWRRKAPQAIHVLGMWEGGKTKYYMLTDPTIYRWMARGLQVNEYVKWYSKVVLPVVRQWKSRITQTVRFGIFNWIARDPLTSGFMQKDIESFIPHYYSGVSIVDILKGSNGSPKPMETELLSRTLDQRTRLKQKGIWDSFTAMMAEGVKVPNWSEMSLWEKLANIPGIANATIFKWVDMINWVSGGRAISAWGENRPRHGAYLKAMRKGYSPATAQIDFDQISGHFIEKQGNPTLAAFVRTLGFLNPALQIGYGIAHRLSHYDPKVQAFYLAKLGLPAIWGAAAAALNFLAIGILYDDEEEREFVLENMRNRPDEDRLNYMYICGQVRLPMEYGILGSLFSYGWNSTEESLLGDPINAKTKAIKLLQRARELPGITDLIPPHFKTAAELKLNYSFYFDNEIVPGWMEKKYINDPKLQTWPNMPKIYDEIGTTLSVSPIKVRYAMRSLFSRQADDVFALLDRLWKEQPPMEKADYPIVGRLLQREPRGWYSQDVKYLSELNREWEYLRRKAREVKERYKLGHITKEKAKKLYVEFMQQTKALNVSHRAMMIVEKRWGLVKRERKKKDPNFEQMRQWERKMTSLAREYIKRNDIPK